jgi:tripartite-type tricarboxylate transporter receptor subunit TctC
MITTLLFRTLTPLVLSGMAAAAAHAQAFPTRPIKIVAAAAPGGTTDFLARLLAEKVSASLKQTVIVENKGGAGGNLAAEAVAKAPADGYTLLMAASSHATNVSLYAKLGYDPVKDFEPITQLVITSFALTVPASSPVNNVAEFVTLAKSRKGGLNYASAGSGQGGHLGMEQLKRMANFEATHVPYPGIGPATNALLAGTVDVSILTLPGVLPHAKSGKLKILAVTGTKRSVLMPTVPTVAESGYRAYDLTSWQGLLAPHGTPKAVVDKLNAEFVKALNEADVQAKLATFDLDPVGSGAEEFSAFIKTEIVRLGRLIKESGAKVE